MKHWTLIVIIVLVALVASCRSAAVMHHHAAAKPPAPSPATSSPPAVQLSCSSFHGIIRKILADATAQQATMKAEGPGLSQATKDQFAAGAWGASTGTYNATVTTFISDVQTSGVTFGSGNGPINSTLSGLETDANLVVNDYQDGLWQSDSSQALSDWKSFQADIDGPNNANAAVVPLNSIC